MRPDEFEFDPGVKVAKLTFGITARNRGRGIGQSVYLGIHADDGGGLRYDTALPEKT
jgi:hypothetical protein